MFQYAAARRLAHYARAELVLHPVHADAPIGSFWVSARIVLGPARDFALDRFNIAGRVLGPNERLREPFTVQREHRGADFSPQAVVKAAGGDLMFKSDILHCTGNNILIGNWHDERYFADIASIIRAELTLRTPLQGRNAKTLRRIRAAPSVFMHVRRGDYLAPKNAEFHGVCPPDYYDRALARLREAHSGTLNVFVFSDQPELVRDYGIGGSGATIIDWNGGDPVADLVLMSACRHAIIANSTFSWWGAWLGEIAGGIIIAPRIWYKTVPSYQEIVPARWQLV